MDEIIRIEKTYEQRLQEYTKIFTGDGPFSLLRIQKSFSAHLELLIEPSGWQAVWKVPKATCYDYKISFPTVLLVHVENVDWKRLTAKVKVLAVLDDIHLPETHAVPLIQLWPLKDQNKRYSLVTANALDVVRFFYTNLYMPWDDDETDWVKQHLENRLQIFYDLKNGIFPRKMAKHIRCLLTTAKNLHEEMEYVVCDEELIELQVSLVEIQKKMELLENPLARKVLIKRAKQPFEDVIGIKDWLVYKEGSLDDYLKFLSMSKKDNTDDMMVVPSLLDSWDAAGSNRNNFILKEGIHCIDEIGILEEGGILTGISGREKTKIISSNNTVIFDLSADALFENLTLVCSTQSAIVVRRGKLTIKNCKIDQDTNTRDYQGIVVLSGASLEIKDSAITGFNFAIIGNKDSSININNCEILDSQYGLKVYDNCFVELENSKINNCTQYGIWVEANSGDKQQLIAGFPVLEKYF